MVSLAAKNQEIHAELVRVHWVTQTITTEVVALKLSPAGRYLVALFANSAVAVLDVADGLTTKIYLEQQSQSLKPTQRRKRTY